MSPKGLILDEKLIQKYGERSFMYTEYPNLRFWSHDYKDPEYRAALIELFRINSDVPLMLYVHIPHCHTQCLFCTCHVVITKNYEDVRTYLGVLYKEIVLLKQFFKENGIRPNFREVHLGGGSPTYPNQADFDVLMDKLQSIANLENLDEFAIEIDPRRIRPEKLGYYRSKGINRISFGIQDFDLEVQKAVDRVQPAKLTERFLTPELRGLFKNGVNFDIICGLPRQTRDSMRRTMEKVVEMSPERICMNYMHFIPGFHPHQLRMPAFPDNYERKMLFLEAMEILLENGYIRTGYDHFAKPVDDVVRAMYDGKMSWNRLGVTAGRYEAVIGIGVSGVSNLASLYDFQNYFSSPETGIRDYVQSLLEGKFPILRGYKLSQDDRIRREVIQTLRNYFYLDTGFIEEKYSIGFRDYFRTEMALLEECQEDGIVEIRDASIQVTDIGKQVVDAVCSKFDIYIR